MTSVLDQQVSGQASAMGSKGDGGGDPPGKKPSDVGREHQEEASEDYIPLEYHVGEDETCPFCGKHKGPHKQLERCKICGRIHAAKCREICSSEKHSTKNHRDPVKSSNDDAAEFAPFLSAGFAKSLNDDAADFARFLSAGFADRYGVVTKPGQGRGQRRGQNRGSGRGRGRGRGRGQRGGQRGGSGRGQSRGQGGGGGRGRGKADPKQEDGSQGTAPRKGNHDDDTQM